MALNSRKNKPNEFVQLSVTLFGITFVVALLLALVNFFTSSKIEMINKEKLEVAMATVMPDAKSFEDMTDSVLPEWNNETSLIGIQAAKDGSGNIVGYCAHVAPKGYSAEIDMMVGINAQGEITDTSIISISDTPGIGTQVNEEEYKAQFVGKEGNLTAIKGSQAGNGEVLLISGATYSSTGFTNGVNAALQAYEMIVGEGA